MSDQPEALRLADLLEKAPCYTQEDGTVTLYLGGTVVADKAAACLRRQHAEIASLKEELETERVRLAACGVVAMANTLETAAKWREMRPEYRSASCDDVAKAVDREMALRAERDALLLTLRRAEEVVELSGLNAGFIRAAIERHEREAGK